MEAVASVANVLALVTTVGTTFFTFVGNLIEMVTGNPLLLIFVIIAILSAFLGLGYGLLRKFKFIRGGGRRR